MRANVYEAIEHLKTHTLSHIPGEIGKLIYIAGTRDYNIGKYYHDGLYDEFTEEAACEALAICHQQVFQALAGSTLQDVVTEIDTYIKCLHFDAAEFLRTWTDLEPYRVSIPRESHPALRQLFFSNLKIALLILQHFYEHPGTRS